MFGLKEGRGFLWLANIEYEDVVLRFCALLANRVSVFSASKGRD